MTVLGFSQAGLWTVCLINLVLVLLIYRQFGLVAMSTAEGHENDGVVLGDEAPPLHLARQGSNELVTVQLAGRWALLLFGTPYCEPCVATMAQVNAEYDSLAELGILVVGVLHAPEIEAKRLQQERGFRFECFADLDGSAATAYGVRVTPFAFLVDPQQRVATKSLASGERHVRSFLESVGALVSESRARATNSPQATEALR